MLFNRVPTPRCAFELHFGLLINKLMRIYTPIKLELIRLTIKGNCQDTQYLNLMNTTHADVIEYIIKTFSAYMIKSKEFRTTIDIRHCIGGDNLSSQRVTLYGIKPFEVIKVLNYNLKDK